jgi:hypothetical protein
MNDKFAITLINRRRQGSPRRLARLHLGCQFRRPLFVRIDVGLGLPTHALLPTRSASSGQALAKNAKIGHPQLE